jgi:hypothetical protein
VVFEVEITPEGLRHLNQLPGKVRDAAIQAILGPSPSSRGASANRLWAS